MWTSKDFSIRLDKAFLRTLIGVSKLELEQVISYFFSQIEQILASEPNVKRVPTGKVRKGIALVDELPEEKKVWVLREYFPNTPIMYKISAVYNPPLDLLDPNYHWRDNKLRPGFTWVVIGPAINKAKPSLRIEPGTVKKIQKQLAEYELIGHSDIDIPLKPLKRMAPKGIKLSKSKKTTK